MSAIRMLSLTLLMLTGVSMAAIVVAEEKEPVGTVNIDETQFALIIGGSTGGGTLDFEGKEYPFKTGGLSLGVSIGVSKVSLAGDVYDMTDVSKFPGTYRKFAAGVALGGGGAALHLKNENGVILKLSGTTKGLSLDISASGMTIEMK